MRRTSKGCSPKAASHQIRTGSVRLRHTQDAGGLRRVEHRVGGPDAGQVGLELRLARGNPRRIVALGDLHGTVPQQGRHALHRYALEQQLDGLRITETVRVAALNTSKLAEATESAAPVAGQRLF